jgi:hypothetical protein
MPDPDGRVVMMYIVVSSLPVNVSGGVQPKVRVEVLVEGCDRSRGHGRARLALAAALVTLTSAGLVSMPQPAAAQSSNPCDSAALAQCTSALGPLRDVTANWRYYQPSVVQPVPISDYCSAPPACTAPLGRPAGGDPEDANPPTGAGWCGTETYNPPPNISPSTMENSLHGYPRPPGKNAPYSGPYCFLRYLHTDFDPLCKGCRRVLLDYAAIRATGPRAEGHWAGRFTLGADTGPLMPFNAHSPNVKNLCSDKFFNPAPGSGCNDPIASFDTHGHSLEGDTAYYHHFPKEGRYFNGPAYLAGDGISVRFHWVQGIYFDVNPNSSQASPAWYAAGYRDAADSLPDTDQSYGCACETLHQTYSASYPIGSR